MQPAPAPTPVAATAASAAAIPATAPTPAKNDLRKQARTSRRALTPAARNRAARLAARNFIHSRKLASADAIAVYLAVGYELDTEPLIEALLRADRQVYVPKLRVHPPMHLVRLRRGASLRIGRHDIAAPAAHSPRTLLRRLDVIVLPLVAFDASGRRLGSGGGNYDRLLAERHAARRPLLIGYAFSAQRVEVLPEDPWDRRLDAVVTEQGVTWFH